MTNAPAKFEVAKFNSLRDAFSRNWEYPLHHVTCAPTLLKLLHPKVEEEMHLQENTVFDLLTLILAAKVA